MSFSRFPLHPDLLKGVKELGFLRPTPIQERAIPPALEGKDLLACAMTGSGKTAAFLLPILNRLIGKPRGATRALILTPTRELAAQIHSHLEKLAVHTPVSGCAVFGGVDMGPQEHALRRRVDVVVATPGRLLDHLSKPYARLDKIEVLVLDEADRMLDMGFLPDIRRILKAVPARRQTLFFSATLPREIVKLAGEMLHHPVALNVERKSAPAVAITQAAYPVGRELKSALLLALLRDNVIEEAIVFTRTKHRTNRLAEFLERNGVATARIHGNRSQGQRTAALEGFKTGKHRILVATDIVARGIDVVDLSHVVNFDVPVDADAYIHRIGRTARAEATGSAFTFVSPEEEGELRAIERIVGRQLPRVKLPGFDYDKKPEAALEIPLRERIAAIRAQKAAARANKEKRAVLANLERKNAPPARKSGRNPSHSPARPHGAQAAAGPRRGERRLDPRGLA